MFKSRTVFVVGAGASAEAELPIGSKLITQIAAMLKFEAYYNDVKQGDRAIYNHLVNLATKLGEKTI